MLYTYKHIRHNFEKLHLYIEHTVLEVWCNPSGNFSKTKLHVDFKPMVESIKEGAKRRKNGIDYLYEPIKNIYGICSKLKKSELKKLSDGFKANNAIKELCEGKGTPLLFDEIKKLTKDPAINKKLHDQLQTFGKNLYKELPKLKPCKDIVGELDNYYDEFVTQNKAELCPFCGLLDIKSKRLSVRDAFDHFLSKDKYPFISVNTENLAPMCYDCNSGYKNQVDPINKGAKSRKAFYPLSNIKTDIEIKIALKTKDIKSISMKDLDITFTNKKQQEKVDTWAEIFKIEERYKDKCCKEKDGKFWHSRIIDESINFGLTPKQLYEMSIIGRKANPYSEDNFLQVPFIEACNAQGLYT